MKKRLYQNPSFLLCLILLACSSEIEKGIITEKRKLNEGIQTIAYPDTFENKESYSIYLKSLRCYRKEDYDCSKKLLEQALSIDPDNAVLLNDLGITEMRLYNYDNATKHFKKAIDINNRFYGAYCNLGMNYYYDDRYSDGIEILRQVPVDSTGRITRRALYYHLLMNHNALMNCDSVYHYYHLIKEFARNKVFLENVEEFLNEEVINNCPQHGVKSIGL